MDEKKRKVALDWMRKIHTLEHAHRIESIKWKNINNWLGVPSLIIAAVIGAIAGLCELKGVAGISVLSTFGGVTIAILAGIQTFVKPSELAEKHRHTSTIFEQLRHKIEYTLEFINGTEQDKFLDSIRQEWSQIELLNVSKKNFQKAKGWIDDMNKYPEELGFLETIVKQ